MPVLSCSIDFWKYPSCHRMWPPWKPGGGSPWRPVVACLRLGVSGGGAGLTDGSRLGEVGKFQSVSGLEDHRSWQGSGWGFAWPP